MIHLVVHGLVRSLWRLRKAVFCLTSAFSMHRRVPDGCEIVTRYDVFFSLIMIIGF